MVSSMLRASISGRIRVSIVLAVASALVLTFLEIAAAGGGAIEETALNPSGEVYEINAAPDGRLLVSDAGVGELWIVNPVDGTYTRYATGQAIRDAQMETGGTIWWTDYAEAFGVVDPDAGELTYWDVSQVITRGLNFGGIAFDAAGKIWISEWFGSSSQLHRFDPSSETLCSYSLPVTSAYSYLLEYDGVDFWLMNWFKDRMIRFNPSTLAITAWTVQNFGADDQGLIPDSNGGIWFVDTNRTSVSRLDPATNQKTNFALPIGSGAENLAISDDLIWYSENISTTVGVLDPAAASGAVTTLTTETRTAVAGPCADLSSVSASYALPAPQTGSLPWADVGAVTLVDANGWTVYDLPSGPVSKPFLDIAAGGDYMWVTDQGRQKLVRFSQAVEYPVYLPVVVRP